MPDTPSITINKDFTYRGKTEVWSNTYHFSGQTPSNDAAWLALALAVWGAERPMLSTRVKFRGYLGYEAGNNHAVSLKDYVADGVAQPSGGVDPGGEWSEPAGDQAGVIRWTTPDRTSKGKRIYLRKYMHGIGFKDDTIVPTVKTAMQNYAAKMIDGTLPGGFKVCGPQGAVASAPLVSPYITTRTLKRRGKRPSR